MIYIYTHKYSYYYSNHSPNGWIIVASCLVFVYWHNLQGDSDLLNKRKNTQTVLKFLRNKKTAFNYRLPLNKARKIFDKAVFGHTASTLLLRRQLGTLPSVRITQVNNVWWKLSFTAKYFMKESQSAHSLCLNFCNVAGFKIFLKAIDIISQVCEEDKVRVVEDCRCWYPTGNRYQKVRPLPCSVLLGITL